MNKRGLKTVAIIQARMGSTRLPGKVLKDLNGETVLSRVVKRARRAAFLNEVIVATSILPADDVIVEHCKRLDVECFRGDELDVLDRYYQAACKANADLIVRITSDCPLIDPQLIDAHVERLIESWSKVDFVTNMVKQTYPLGLAVEAMPRDVLARMKRMSDSDALKEHVTSLVYAEPHLFKIENVLHPVDLSDLRWTVDTQEDLDLVRLLFRHFGHDRFSWEEVLPLMKQHPEWVAINKHVRQKTG
jgi:spore coat polysaccharide biosynthesis protein SpsF